MKGLFLFSFGSLLLAGILSLLGYMPNGMGWQVIWPFIALGGSVFAESIDSNPKHVESIMVGSLTMSSFLIVLALLELLGVAAGGEASLLRMSITPIIGFGHYFNRITFHKRQERKAKAAQAAE